MAGEVVFTVTDPIARRLVIQPEIRQIAEELAGAARSSTPRDTGALAGGWRLVQGRDPGTTLVVNDVLHGLYVEYGTRRRPAVAMLGRALASRRGG